MSIVCVALAAIALQGWVLPKPSPESVVAFVDVHVLPMTQGGDGVLDHQTVIVRGNRIVQMGPAAQVRTPAGAVTVDGRGKYLMPGLGEMHGQLPSPGAGPELTENVLFLYVATGVTTVRVMEGNLASLDLKARIARGELLGPRLWVTGPTLTANAAPTPAAGRRLVEEQQAAGFDELDIGEGLSRETYDTIVASARRLGIRFGGSVPDAVGEHAVTSLPGAEDSATLAARPELRYMPPSWRANWALHLYSVPGFSLQRTMRSMTAAGLSAPQILTEATRQIARYFGAEQEFGTVAPGRRADLLLVSGNPLADLANVGRRVGVMVNGRWLPEAEIEARLGRIAAAYQ